MAAITIEVDDKTAAGLRVLGISEGKNIDKVSARILAHAVRSAGPRPVYDVEAIRRAAAEFEAEDLALAESDVEHRAELLANEDCA